MSVETGALKELTGLGQSVWLDYIRRGILDDGQLASLIEEKFVRGVTSNPAIFEKAITGSTDYDSALASMRGRGVTPTEAYEKLAIEDIQQAADLFLPLYEASGGADGFVSLEVSPELAHDGPGSLAEARRFWSAVARPNVMIKIPGTDEGLDAVEHALADGININITLLFSLDGYERVMERYLAALERRTANGLPLDRIASVASFFVSRVDSAVDAALDEKAAATSDQQEKERILALRGKAAIANAKLAYRSFQQVFGGDRFARLKSAGARVQRPLWASTSTKNPAYRDVLYVEELIGPDTVNTMPLQTMEAFADHGVARRTVDIDIETSQAIFRDIEALGIDLVEVTHALQREGVEKFVLPFRDLLASIEGAIR